MTPDWKALSPHRPLPPGDERYVVPPVAGDRDIAARISAGSRTILVGGPAGVGKSTEMARAAALLRGQGNFALVVPVDVWENMRRITPEQLLLRIAGRVAYVAMQFLKPPASLSHDLLAVLVQAGVLGESVLQQGVTAIYKASPLALAGAALTETARVTNRHVCLLIDGMEKVADAPSSVELFEALGSLPEDVDLAVVVPWHAAFGSRSETVVRPGEHWSMLAPPPVDGDEGAPTRKFMRSVLARRLGLDPGLLEPGLARFAAAQPAMAVPTEFVTVVEQASIWSGGIVRTFLQLVADAGTYARLNRQDAWPNESDLADAIADLEDSFRRSLLPGDTPAALAAAGTDGRELKPARKVRLLSRGVLIERRVGKKAILEVHPLANRVLQNGGGDA